MPIGEEAIRTNFAHNLALFRRKSGLTQAELAEKLNYSDKSVSKWERGEGLPDVYVLSVIAELFDVTVDDLIKEKHKFKPFMVRNKALTTILAINIVWLVAAIVFFALSIFLPSFTKSWLVFVYAVPVSAIVGIVFACIWWNKICRAIFVSLLIWSLAVCVIVTFFIPRIALILSVAGVLQVMTVLWFSIKRSGKVE